MTEIWPGRRAALGGVALCALTVVGGWPDPPAWSATERPLPAVAAVVQAQPNATSVATPSRTETSAGAKKVTASAKRHAPRTPRTTSTTVMGGGKPSTWPAARAKAPSLAGAYSPNLKTAFIALGELLGLVRFAPESESRQELMLADIQTSTRPQVYLMHKWWSRVGMYHPTRPKSISYCRRTPSPITRSTDLVVIGTSVRPRRSIDVVINEKNVPYLDGPDKIVGHSARRWTDCYAVTLVQDISV